MNINRALCALIFPIFILAVPAMAGQPPALKDLAVRQNIGRTLAVEAGFFDENGKVVTLKDFFQGRPVLLTFVYFNCPMLCPLNMKGLAQSLKAIKEIPGRDYELLVVSFDPKDNPEESHQRRQMFAKFIGKHGAEQGIHFLTGKEPDIRRLTESAGFPYIKDDRTGQYGHAAVLLALTPEAKISRYLFGLDYAPRDLRLALADARRHKSGSLTDAVLMYCFAYNPLTGRYTLAILNLLKLAAALTVLILAGLIYLLKRRETIA